MRNYLSPALTIRCLYDAPFNRGLGDCIFRKKKRKGNYTGRTYIHRTSKCRSFKSTLNSQRTLDSKFSERFYTAGRREEKKERNGGYRHSSSAHVCSRLVHPRLAMLIFIVKRTTVRFFPSSSFSIPFHRLSRSLFYHLSGFINVRAERSSRRRLFLRFSRKHGANTKAHGNVTRNKRIYIYEPIRHCG